MATEQNITCEIDKPVFEAIDISPDRYDARTHMLNLPGVHMAFKLLRYSPDELQKWVGEQEESLLETLSEELCRLSQHYSGIVGMVNCVIARIYVVTEDDNSLNHSSRTNVETLMQLENDFLNAEYHHENLWQQYGDGVRFDIKHHNHEAYEAAFEQAINETTGLLEQIANIPAQGLSSLVLKARCVRDYHQGMSESIVKDLLALRSIAPSNYIRNDIS